MNGLKRCWIEFDFKYNLELHYNRFALGCGITAFNNEDALNILEEKIFHSYKGLSIEKMIEDVHIRTLDQNHVVPNMNSPHIRGVWFPMGFE